MKNGTHIVTLENGYHLFTRTVGSGKINLLCLHGGPGGTHEEFEHFDEHLADLGVRVSMYDQLGSYFSDQPDFSDPAIRDSYLTFDYYIDEIEEVRQKLGLDHFYLLGHSWGGLIAQEYALKYGQHLKGLIIMSMIDNIAEYTPHVNQLRQETLTPFQVSYMEEIEKAEKFEDPEYQHYVHILDSNFSMRNPEARKKVAGGHLATAVYNYFQGNNEFVMVGKLNGWDVRDRLHEIKVPTLLTFGDHDTMPLAAGRRMQQTLPHARFVLSPNSGHSHSRDNPAAFFHNLKTYLRDVEEGTFTSY